MIFSCFISAKKVECYITDIVVMTKFVPLASIPSLTAQDKRMIGVKGTFLLSELLAGQTSQFAKKMQQFEETLA